MEEHLLKTVEELFGYAEDPIVIVTLSQKIKFMNRKAASLFQSLNCSPSYLKLTKQSEQIWPNYVEKLKKSSTDSCVITVQLQANHYLTMRLHSYYMPEQQLVVSRITIPSQLEKNTLENYQYQPIDHMIQNIAHGIVLTSLSGQVVNANAKALQYLECHLHEIKNRSHDCLFIDMDQEGKDILNYYRQLANYESATLDVSKMQKNGQLCYYRIESKIDSALNLIITTVVDETEKMTLLNRAEHQDALFLIGQNFASIAHELRNPITSITGFLQLIRDDMDQNCQRFVQIMESELQRMDNMLADVLNFSKPKRIHFESFCLLELIEEVVDIMQVQAILSRTLLEIEYKKMAEHMIFGHRARIKQMVINLVKNAIEATSSSGKIIVKLVVPHLGKCSLLVSDEGMGMTQTTIDNLFNPYYTTKATGTGLGMMFVKKVVDEHNADMMFCTAVGYGTQIKVDFKQQDNQLESFMKHRIYSNMVTELNCS